MTFTADVRDGKIADQGTRAAIVRCIAGFEDKRIRISIDQYRPRRSDEQNRWYWGCIVPMLAEHCGYDKEEMHSALKQRFLRTHADGPLPTVRSTSQMNSKDFSEYVEQCRRLAAEMGVVIPDPA